MPDGRDRAIHDGANYFAKENPLRQALWICGATPSLPPEGTAACGGKPVTSFFVPGHALWGEPIKGRVPVTTSHYDWGVLIRLFQR